MPGEESQVPNTDLSFGMQAQVITMQAPNLVHLENDTDLCVPKCFMPGCALDTLLETGTLVLYYHLPILLSIPEPREWGSRVGSATLK